MLAELDKTRQFPLLLIQPRIGLLFLAEFRSSVEKLLKVWLIAFLLKQVDFCEELLFLLLELGDFLL